MEKPYKIELCTEDVNRALSLQHKVDQIEFCSRLDLDGLTPLIRDVKVLLAQCSVPLKIMIRMPSENFSVSGSEINVLIEQAKSFKKLGVDRFVFGALKGDRLDIEIIKSFCAAVYPSKVCIHKAIDRSTHILNDAILILDIDNVEAILTSGGKVSALEGARVLSLMKDSVGRKIEIIGAGGITQENINAINKVANLDCYHGRLIVG